jgi:hypothetical protein
VCCQSLLERLKISDFRRSRVNRRRVTDGYCYNCVYVDGFFRWRPIHVVNIITLRHFDTF